MHQLLHINSINHTVYTSRPPQLKHSTSRNTLNFNIYVSAQISLSSIWYHSICFILCLVEYLRLCSESHNTGAELSCWETIVKSHNPEGLSSVHWESAHTHRYTHTHTHMQARTCQWDTHKSRGRWSHSTPTYSGHAHESSRQGTGCTVSDCALSAGLELTDAQADYSAFSGHMTKTCMPMHSSGAGQRAWRSADYWRGGGGGCSQTSW